MKIKFLVFALFLSLNSLFAQEKTGSIFGKIIDSKTKEGIGFSTVKIKDGSQIIANVMTKEDGSFTFSNLELKSYILEINFVGYKKYSETIELTTSKKA